MAHRNLPALVSGIMGGGLVPVTIGGKTGIAGPFRNVGQPVRRAGPKGGDEAHVKFARQIAPALTLEGGKVRGVIEPLLEAQPMLL